MNNKAKKDALQKLKKLAHHDDAEERHIIADKILLNLIDDDDIRQAYDDIPKWYA